MSLLGSERGLGEDERAERSRGEARVVVTPSDLERRLCVSDRLGEPLAQPEEDAGENLVRAAPDERHLGGVGDGRLEQLHGRKDVVVVGADAGEDDQRLRTLDAGRQLRNRGIE